MQADKYKNSCIRIHEIKTSSLPRARLAILSVRLQYARNTLGSFCQYKEDSLVSRPPSLFTSMRQPMHGTSCPKSQLKSTCLTAKFGSFFDHAETGEKGQNVISSSVQHPISLISAIHVSVIIPLPMMWILLTKPMQKSVTMFTAVLLDWKLGTNVATISWLHWSPVSGYGYTVAVVEFGTRSTLLEWNYYMECLWGVERQVVFQLVSI